MLVGDALDLRHRLPALWARIQAGEATARVGRRIADLTRFASREAAESVDRRVARFAHSLPIGRLEKVAEAAMVAADPDAAAREAALAADQQGVSLAREIVDGTEKSSIRTDASSRCSSMPRSTGC